SEPRSARTEDAVSERGASASEPRSTRTEDAVTEAGASASEPRTTRTEDPTPAEPAADAVPETPTVTPAAPAAPAPPGPRPDLLDSIVIEDGVVRRRIRRPLDLARFVLAVVIAAAIVLLAYFATSTTEGLDTDIATGASLLPSFVVLALNIIGGIGILG